MFTAATTIEDVRQRLRAVTRGIRPDWHLSKAACTRLGTRASGAEDLQKLLPRVIAITVAGLS